MDLPRRTVDAVRMASDASRLQGASEGMLTGAAILVAGAIVQMQTRGGSRELRGAAFELLDRAGRAIAGELRRRQAPVA